MDKNFQLPNVSVLVLKPIRFLCQTRRLSMNFSISHGHAGQESASHSSFTTRRTASWWATRMQAPRP